MKVIQCLSKRERENGIPTYVFPETAVQALSAMTKFAKLGDRKYDDVVDKITDVDKDAVQAIFEKVKADGRERKVYSLTF